MTASVRPAVADRALPALGRLLDADEMAEVLARSLGRGDPVTVRCRSLHYKPQRKLIVRYDVEVDGATHTAVAIARAGRDPRAEAERPAHRELAARVDGRAPAPSPLDYDSRLGALIQWFPLDVALPGLAESGAALARRLRAAGLRAPAHDAALLAYKPLARAIVRLGDHVLKAYGDEPHFHAAQHALRVVARFLRARAALFEAALPDVRMTVQTALAGDPPTDDAAVAAEAGALLRELRRLPADGLPAAPPAAQLLACGHAAGIVAAVAPHLRWRVARLVAALERGLPDAGPVVTSHGDFEAGQLLFGADGPALLDVDQLCLAPAALDPATFAAHVVRDGAGLAEAVAVLDTLLDAAADRPPALGWYLASALLLRAPTPFRKFDPHWLERTEELLAAAEGAFAEAPA